MGTQGHDGAPSHTSNPLSVKSLTAQTENVMRMFPGDLRSLRSPARWVPPELCPRPRPAGATLELPGKSRSAEA